MLVFAVLVLSVVQEAGGDWHKGKRETICQSQVLCPVPERISASHTISCCNHCLQGIVGYGDIGQACARLAKAFKMKVVALRRNTQLSAAEAAEGVVVSEEGPGGLSVGVKGMARSTNLLGLRTDLEADVCV